MSNKEILSIALLDEPQVKLGENVLNFQYRKSMALLAFLATTQKAYSREYLAGFLWGKTTEKNAQAGLRKILSEINTKLSSYLLTENRQIGLNLALPMDVDVLTFEQNLQPIRQKNVELVTNEEIERLEIGLDVYQTGFMTGFYVQKAPAFEDWLSMQRGNLQVLLIDALQLISSYMYRVGEFKKSMDYTRQLLTIEPALEEAHYRLMSLLALSGQRTLALNQYELCKHALADTYGTVPQAETKELFNKIRIDPEIQQQTKKIPVPIMPILGREADIQQVTARLREEKCRILTILGPGGVGKTHLSLMVGKAVNEQISGQFQDGAVFVPLQALQSVHSLSSTIAFQLGYSYDKDQDPVQQLCDYLAPFKLLLILDNFEQLVSSMKSSAAEQYDFVNRILQAAPGVKLLVTSRIRLNLLGEYLYPLQGISFPSTEETVKKRMEDYPAVVLFLQKAEQLLGIYEPDDDEMQAIVEICRFVRGLPLGILLAAGWIRLLSASEIVNKLKSDDEEISVAFLASGGSDMPLRHRNMDSVYRQSWDMISTQQKHALAELSVFAATFSLNAAQAVARIQLSDLIQLIDHSLLERNEQGRFQMHELLRQYVYYQHIDLQPAFERRCTYYSNKIEHWEKAIKGKGQVQAVHEMTLEIDNLRIMWEHAIKMKNTTCLVRVFEGLCLFYDWRQFYSEGLNFCEHVVSMLKTNSTFPEAFSEEEKLRFLSRAITWQSVFAVSSETEILLRESLSILENPVLQDVDVRIEKAFALNRLAVYVSQTGHHNEAFNLYKRCIAIYEDINDDWYLHRVLTAYGPLLWDQSAYEDAYQIFQRSLEIAKRIDDQRGVAYALIWLGNVALYQGDLAGETIIREGFSLIEQIGGEMGGEKGKNQLASSLCLLGQYQEVCELVRAGRNDEKLHFRQDVPQTLYAIGLVHTGDYERAKPYAESGLALARKIKDDYGICLAILINGYLYIIDNKLNEARSLLQEGSDHSKNKDLKELFSWVNANLGLTETLDGNLERAGFHLGKALEMAMEINGYGAKCFAMAVVPAWMKAIGKINMATACWYYIRQFPVIGNSVWYQQFIGGQIDSLAENLVEDEFADFMEQFTAFSLDQMIGFVLTEIKNGDRN